MYTQCPACHTVLTVTPAQLAAARGTVRCGACQHPFNALDRLAATLPPRARAAAQAMQSEAKAAAPAPRENRSAEEAAPMPAASSVYFPPPARGKSRAPHPLATLAWTVGIVIALGVLVLQYAYFMRNDLARYSQLRPWLEQLCRVADCRIPPQRDVARIAVLNRQVIEDPSAPGALLVRATIENQAPFAQPYPIVQLSLSDINGRLLGRGRFTPQQYLVKKDLPAQLPSRTPIEIRLKIADPGSNAVNFEFTFL